MKSTARKWLAVITFGTMVGGSGVVSVAEAAPCIAGSAFTDPDASLTNSTSCGIGIGNNDTAAGVQAATGDPDWALVGSVGSPLSLTFTGTTGGNWFIDAAAPGGTDWLIVIKDGDTGADFKWTWFVVDTNIACVNVAYDYCGTWTMYGTNANVKDISHMSLYSQAGNNIRIPEPATLVLLGTAAIGLALSRRRARVR